MNTLEITKRALAIIALAVLIVIAIGTVDGCALFRGNNLPYDVAITLSLPNGDTLVASTDQYGLHIAGQYRSPMTGIVYMADEKGAISATWTDPATGQVQEIKLTPKE